MGHYRRHPDQPGQCEAMETVDTLTVADDVVQGSDDERLQP
ncbi:hypothetical protein [Azohydromonas australica]|nr:hypothetical protein [Azohydromonas australica]